MTKTPYYGYLRQCRKCGGMYRTSSKYQTDPTCANCRIGANPKSKQHRNYIDAKQQQEDFSQRWNIRLNELKQMQSNQPAVVSQKPEV